MLIPLRFNIISVLPLMASLVSAAVYPEVKTGLGDIRGRRVNVEGTPIDEFLGIPFAKPPTGNHRFREPRPIGAWSETFIANKARACVQFLDKPFPWRDDEKGTSEDCLTLNIWSPPSNGNAGTKKAVMFWIFGGAFCLGSNRKEIYNGKNLAAIGDVIVVTTNHRLGPLGFLHSNSTGAPGNVALYDILEGLKWVREHIHAFGGDKDSITLMGQASGAYLVSAFSASPLTKGLFKKAILESTSAINAYTDDANVDFMLTEMLANATGCSSESKQLKNSPEVVVKCLRETDIETLVKKTIEILPPTTLSNFLPRYGDSFLPRNPRLAITQNDFEATDLLAGNNRDEGSAIMTIVNPELFGFFGEKNTKINKTVGESIIRHIFQLVRFPDIDDVVKQYLGGIDDNNHQAIREATYSAFGDYVIVCPTVYYSELTSKRGKNVHYYLFNYQSEKSPWAKWMGAAHNEEVQFVFGQPLRSSNYPAKSKEVDLSRKMMELWTTFAKRGLSENEWPKYSRENPDLLNLDIVNFSRGRGPNRKNCDFFRPYLGKK